MTDRNSNRCCATEALNRYINECDKNERIYEQNCEDMYAELDEAIAKKYELQSEAKEYMEDRI